MLNLLQWSWNIPCDCIYSVQSLDLFSDTFFYFFSSDERLVLLRFIFCMFYDV